MSSGSAVRVDEAIQVVQARCPARDDLSALLAWRAQAQGDRLAVRFMDVAAGEPGQCPATSWSYRDWWARARSMAMALRGAGLSRQDSAAADAPLRVMLAFGPGLDFLAAFIACLHEGVLPVPMPTPRRRGDEARWSAVARVARPAGLLTTSDLVDVVRGLWPGDVPQPAVVETDRLLESAPDALDLIRPVVPAQGDVAFLQFTSGSTRAPRGVCVTHANLGANLAAIERLFGHDESSRGLIWLPPHHDMGLIGGLLAPLFSGFPVTLMSPAAFTQHPLRWLRAIAHERATTSGGPNFAYEHALSRLHAADLHGLDLSCWRVAFTGAEPVKAGTLARWAEVLAPAGFQPQAFLPCYGLAESTLMVSGRHGQPRTLQLSRAAFERGEVQALEAAAPAEASALQVSCGRPDGEAGLLIVDPESSRPLGAGRVGEIWLSGPSVAAGYWHEDKAAACFGARLQGEGAPQGAWLRTGDLGFLHEGELFVTGRLKDLLIVRGRNLAPQDLEVAAWEAHDAIGADAVAAFMVEQQDDGQAGGGRDRLVLVAELRRQGRHSVDHREVLAAMRAALSRVYQVQADALALVAPLALPRTSSGKLQRARCARLWQEGALPIVAEWRLPDAVPSTAVPIRQAPGETPEGEDRAEALCQWLRDYAGHAIRSRLMDERRALTPSVVLDFGNRGLMGMLVPPRWQGLGLGHTGFLRVIGQLAAIDATLGLFVGLGNVLGVGPVLHHARPEVRDEWLPRLATGRELAAFALSEAGAGSNPMAMQAVARAQSGGRWYLSGDKVWSGAAAWAGVTHVFTREVDAQGRMTGIGAFMVRRGSPGVRQGEEAMTMGMRAMVQNSVHLREVAVGEADRLGRPGEGMAVAQQAMMLGRLTIAAACAGGMKRCAQLMLRYARRRQVASGRLLDQPVLQARLADITAGVDVLHALVGRMAGDLDAGLPVHESLFVACKVLAPEWYWQAVDHLMQALGGRGYIESNLVPQMMRDARVLRIFEGPTETMAAYLGGLALHQGDRLKALVDEQPAGAGGAVMLDDVLSLVRRTDAQGRAVGALLTVEAGIAVAHLLAGAVLRPDAGPARPWIDAETRRALERLARAADEAAGSGRDTSRVSASALCDRVAAYARDIGDVEQSLPGEDHTPDPWLSRGGAPDLAAPQPDAASGRSTPVLSEVRHEAPVQASAHPSPAAIRNWLMAWLATRLGVQLADLDAQAALVDQGVDSVLGVEMVHAIEAHFPALGELDATLAWSHPTVHALAGMIASRLAAAAPAAVVTEVHDTSGPSDSGGHPQAVGLDALSDDDLARLLAEELARSRDEPVRQAGHGGARHV